jgi:hypothetical protein
MLKIFQLVLAGRYRLICLRRAGAEVIHRHARSAGMFFIPFILHASSSYFSSSLIDLISILDPT